MRKCRWNWRKCLGNMAVLLTVLGVNVLAFWMLVRWVMMGGAA